MRSLLFVPGDSERKLNKAMGSGADVLIVDLEDSVAAGAKSDARRMARDFIGANGAAGAPAFYVRVNDLSTGLTDEDLAAVMAARPAGIMLPKSNGGADVTRLDAKLRTHEAEQGIEDGATRILPLITETPRGVFAAATYAGASSRLSGISWGAEDLSAAIGARRNRDADGRYTALFGFARTVTLLAAADAETAAIDTVFPNFRDMEAFRAECIEAELDGFTGRMAIHPAQVPVINEVFTPSEDAVSAAKALIAAFAEAGDAGVVAIDGEMYDRPHLRRAERVIARARSAGVQ